MSRRQILRGTAAAGATAIGAASGVSAAERSVNDIRERGSPDLTGGDAGRTVTIQAAGEVRYTLSVTGLLSAADAPADAVDAGTATGTLSSGAHSYSFSGEFTELDVEGDATVLVDGEPIDVDAFPQQRIAIVPEGTVDLDLSASGAVEAEEPSLDQPNKRTVRGSISDTTVVAYAGELTYLDVDGEAAVREDVGGSTGGRRRRARRSAGGDAVEPSAALPSRFPGEVTFSGSGGSVTVEIAGEADADDASVSVDDGRIEAAAEGSTARYDGAVETVTFDSGASAEIDPESKHVICSAGADSDATFSLTSTEAFIHEETVFQEPEVTVEAGATERVRYFGDVTSVAVGGTDVSFDDEAYEDAARSARLQLAARFERLDAYERLESAAEGRVRHDADGIFAVTADNPRAPAEAVSFKLTDVEQGDAGTVTVTTQRDTGSVVNAQTIYQWHNDGGVVERSRLETLELAGASSVAAASVSTETYEYDVPEGATAEDVQAQGWIPTIPWGDWIGDIYDGLTDVASDIAAVSADYLAEAIEYAEVSANEIAVTAGKIVCNTVNAFQELAVKFMDDFKIKALWKLRITGYASIISLAGSGVFRAIGNQNYDCGACIAFIRIGIDLGICDVGVTAACGAIGFASLGLGGVACAALGGAICSLVFATLPSAEDICSGHTAPAEADFC